jgi:phenylalanyl-tRNA synthetase beta chain
MNIKILDSWLKEFLDTDATPKQIADRMSLTSVGVERIEKWKNDFLYDIEVTTNRPELASVVGLAREAGAVLPQSGLEAKFTPPKLPKPTVSGKDKESVTITFDPKLVNRICAVVMEVTVKQSPEEISNRLEASDIRSLNNIIDVTNYVMRTIGHPTHVFDFDKISGASMHIRESKKGEKITTLDGKTYVLPGGDIVAADSSKAIVDLLAIMGLKNSVVSEQTKLILFFVNNNETSRIRRTSMTLGIRTEAAQLNEKGIDPELAMDALLYGIELYKKIAGGKIISDIIDIYPIKPKPTQVSVSIEKIKAVIGIEVPEKTSAKILTDLGFTVKIKGAHLEATVPSYRLQDVSIPEDLIEEIARVYGYFKIPSIIPSIQPSEVTPIEANEFYWEDKIRQALKYWGFTEAYTYHMVSDELYLVEGERVKLANPLGTEYVYMRAALTPSLLSVLKENKRLEQIKLFEIANVYKKKKNDLPVQSLHIGGVIKAVDATFYTAKGILEQLFTDLGIETVSYKEKSDGNFTAEIQIEKDRIGDITIHDKGLITFELLYAPLLKYASRQKKYRGISGFPPVFEDMSFVIPDTVPTGDILSAIKKQSRLIKQVSLLDRYEGSRTFHIIYQDENKNLTSGEIEPIRKKISLALKDEFGGTLKSS